MCDCIHGVRQWIMLEQLLEKQILHIAVTVDQCQQFAFNRIKNG